MIKLNASCTDFNTSAGIAMPAPHYSSKFRAKHLFIPVYGHRTIDNVYELNRDGNIMTVLGYIKNNLTADDLCVMAVPVNITQASELFLSELQYHVAGMNINLVYISMIYGDDPRHTRILTIDEMCDSSRILAFFDFIYVAPQIAAKTLYQKTHTNKDRLKLRYLAYAIAGLECQIESYKKASMLDKWLYERMPTLIGTLDQAKLYPEAARITKGYLSCDLYIRPAKRMKPIIDNSTKAFILMPWKPSHEPYKVHILLPILYEFFKLGVDIVSPYTLMYNGECLTTRNCKVKQVYEQALSYGKLCVIPLLEPMHHCLHHSIYEFIANNNTIITVPNEELGEPYVTIVSDELAMEAALAKALGL